MIKWNSILCMHKFVIGSVECWDVGIPLLFCSKHWARQCWSVQCIVSETILNKRKDTIVFPSFFLCSESYAEWTWKPTIKHWLLISIKIYGVPFDCAFAIHTEKKHHGNWMCINFVSLKAHIRYRSCWHFERFCCQAIRILCVGIIVVSLIRSFFFF